jgi:hypothetical protein
MQKPTVGRVVHFFPATTDALYRNGEPLAATIVRVWSQTCVNLALFDGDAHLHARTSVQLHQDGTVPLNTGYAAWPARESVLLEAKLANPHTGALRDLRDVASDPQAVLCMKPGEPLKAAPAKVAITDEMVGRFLSWPLPADFAPDCGISFTPSPHAGMTPTGTNLLHFGQAKAMLEHCINGPSASFAVGIDLGKEHQAQALQPQPPISDEAAEKRIREAGADVAPRVTKFDIDALMARVVYTYEQRPNGSTATFCHAFLDGRFFLASGMSACVSTENFNAELGRDMAMNKAVQLARDKLWELEGYRLHATMVSDAEFIGGSMAIAD